VDSSLSASAHVSIGSEFNKTNVSTWPVNAFLVASMISQPIYPRLSDHVGRKIPFLAASVFFNSGLLLSCSASTWNALIFARAISGLGVGGLMTMGMIKLFAATRMYTVCN
jgi:MFS family permease